MEKIQDKDFTAYIKRKREEAIKIADAEEREKRRNKSYDPRNDKEKMQENVDKYSDALFQKVLPNMKGYMGIWNKEVPPPPNGKRNLLYVMAKRQARLQAQVEWIRAEQERHKKTEDEIELFSKKVANV